MSEKTIARIDAITSFDWLRNANTLAGFQLPEINPEVAKKSMNNKETIELGKTEPSSIVVSQGINADNEIWLSATVGGIEHRLSNVRNRCDEEATEVLKDVSNLTYYCFHFSDEYRTTKMMLLTECTKLLCEYVDGNENSIVKAKELLNEIQDL